jgi:hypothetical protein
MGSLFSTFAQRVGQGRNRHKGPIIVNSSRILEILKQELGAEQRRVLMNRSVQDRGGLEVKKIGTLPKECPKLEF